MDRHSAKVTDPFFALLQAGLWEKEVRFRLSAPVNYKAVFNLASEQSVVGLLAAGLEHVPDVEVKKSVAVTILKKVLASEKRNRSMNAFIGDLSRRLKEAGIDFLLVKGQGVGQCYARPQWRYSGDVDFVFTAAGFEKAKAFFRPLVEAFDPDNDYTRHISITLDSWAVELHADQHAGLSYRIDKVMDRIQSRCLEGGEVRMWDDDGTLVALPSPDNDVFFIFTHFLKHFYKGGIGLRQLCDLCRLLWTYRDSIDRNLLGERLHEMRLMTEWKAFGCYCVTYLGMPAEAMPFWSDAARWKRKAKRINRFILNVGSFGTNRDTSYYTKYPFLVRKAISLGWRVADLLRHGCIFPWNVIRFMPRMLFGGLESAVNGQ